MVDLSENLWPTSNFKIPKYSGVMPNTREFDYSFFGVSSIMLQFADPKANMLLERSFEAIMDAGINPKSLNGSNIGVFVGGSLAEVYQDEKHIERKPVIGTLLANRISFALGLTGPSLVLDTGCSSSAYALNSAYSAIRNGECDAALVCGASLLNPENSMTFVKLGAVSLNGSCRPFDNEAGGYVRAEAIVALYLQKARDAKRIYATILHSKTNCDGYKDEGNFAPSSKMQADLMMKLYKEIEIAPHKVNYVEAHGTGTKVGDLSECTALDEVFCFERDTPLLVGSVKSNMGHSEPASATCGIIKSIFALETGKIAPNLNFEKPREDIDGLQSGRLQVVTEAQELEGSLIAVSSFGIGGTNAHILLKANEKNKINNGAPTDSLPRLVVWSGRTEEAVNNVFDYIEQGPLNAEFIGLLHSTQNDSYWKNTYRGYAVFKHESEKNAICLSRNVQERNSGQKLPIVWVFPGAGSQWPTMGKSFLEIPIIRNSVEHCHDVLTSKGINLMEIITCEDPNVFDNILNTFVGIVAIQIGIVDVLRELGIEPDYIIGHSFGEIVCAYADGCFTQEQAILAAYYRGMAFNERRIIKGSMAVVGLSAEELELILPEDIYIACYNTENLCTISGPAESIKNFVEELESKKIHATEVKTSGVAAHSRYIYDAGELYHSYLRDIIVDAKERSAKWLSSCIPKAECYRDDLAYSSPKYHSKNFSNPVLFYQASKQLPPNCLTIEIAPQQIFQSILKSNAPNGVHVGFSKREDASNVLNVLGEIYTNGVDFAIEKLYSAIEWPVSRGTSSISPLIKWNYSDNPSVRKSGYEKLSKIEFRHVSIDINEPEHEYFKGHLVDDRLIFPGVGYIFLVWETFAIMNAKKYSHFAVTFENIEFKNATLLREDSPTILDIMINPENGQFEVFNFTKSAVTGCIKHTEDPMLFATETNNSLLASSVISKEDFYKNLRMMGLQHHGAFAPVTEFNIDFSYGKIKWDGRWIAFLDGILQVVIFSVDDKEFKLLKTIQKFVIDPKVHFNTIDNLQSENIELEVFRDSKKIKCGGVEVYDAEKVHVTKKISTDHLVTQTHKFVSHLPAPILSSKQATKFCLDIAIENLQLDSYKLVEIDDGKKPLKKCLNQQSAMVESYYLTSQKLDSDSFKAEMFDGVEVVNKSLSSYSDCHFIIKSNCLNDIEFLDNASQSLFDEGFIISREASGIDQEMAQNLPANYQLVALIPTLENETLVLLQLVNEKFTIPQNVVKITNLENETYDWLEKLKVLIKDGSVVVYSQNEPFSGILGFVNCIRKEPGLNSLQCVFIDDPQAPPFEVNHLFYSEQLKLGLAINVLKTGKWGSYRHFPINEAPELRPNSDFAFADIGTPGDLSSFKWFQGPSDLMRADEEEVVSVQYAALNFRDVMVALGKLPNKSSDNQHIAIGFEYAGIKRNGERVIGILLRDAGFASHVKQHHRLRWKCPDNWSLQEAATIPVVYLTVYHSFFNLVQIEKGNTILIHSGCGGVGLAAIRVAFAYGLEVFTTVSTEEKKQFLLQEFPQLKEENIGNSRNTSFEDMIMQRTNGKGVDYILNSLPDEKFEASIRCLAFAGTFIEIAHNSFTGNYKFESDCKIFYSFDLFYLCSEEHKRALACVEMIERDIENGIVKPLKTTVFQASEIEQAFRYLGSGKHIGKVLIQVRETETDKFTVPIPECHPRIYCDRNSSYIILGGLGGVGFELAIFLVSRGCKKLILSSRRGILSGYHKAYISKWESTGMKVLISTSDITTKPGCKELLNESTKLGPIGGIFNLALQLFDGALENQDATKFARCLAPKALATQYLDELSRKMCPDLKYFVVFSSAACGLGNAGQTNYGMANSAMERIIEQRHSDGLPAKAIQLGAIGDIGAAYDMFLKNVSNQSEVQISGCVPQTVWSFFDNLDTIISHPDPIILNIVLPEQKLQKQGQLTTVEKILHLLSSKNLKSIPPETTLSNLGADSIASMEISNILQKEFGVQITPKKIGALSISEMLELEQTHDSERSTNRG